MKWAVSILIGLSICLSSVGFSAEHRTTGFVKIRNNRSLFVDYIAGDSNEPILVMLNGLTYDLTNFDKMIPPMVGHGYGILRYDPWGMGQTLLANGMPHEDIPIEGQAQDLKDLLKALRINKKVTLMGLSYGSGIALRFASTFPNLVDQLILMSPFVSPRNSAPSNQDEIIKAQIQWLRTFQPWNTSSDEDLYNYFLHQLIYETYPATEPSVLSNPYKLEATFRLVQGIRKFFTDDITESLPDASVHMMVANQDQYVPRQMYDDFWSRLDDSKKLSRININGSEHKMPEAIPVYAASWINLIMAGQTKALRQGLVFEGDVLFANAKSGKTVISLPTDFKPVR